MKTTNDPLAHASEIPNIPALIREFENVQQYGPASLGMISAAEDVQFNRRANKSSPPDGKLWQTNSRANEVVRPYDGRPDSDVHLADELILAETDLMLMAAEMAQLRPASTHLTGLTAAQMAELREVAEWCRRATADDLRDDLELAAQMTSKLGWSVLNPGWMEKYELVEREIDIEGFTGQVAQMFGPEAAQDLFTAILEPTLEEVAVQTLQQLFSYLPKNRLRSIVRDLRSEGHATFLDRQISEKRPTLRTLIQGLNYFILGRSSRLSKARGHLVVELYSQADFENTAASNEWHEEFVERAIGTMGQYSTLAEGLQNRAEFEDDAGHDRYIEVWTATVYQYDETIGAAGWYFTVFSPHISPGNGGTETTAADFAKHALLEYACGAPYVQIRRMVEGPGLEDSRGVPEMVRADQSIIKMLQDALVARGHLEVDPPRAFVGLGWSKIDGWNAPGAKVENTVGLGAEVKELGPARGSPQVGEAVIERLENQCRRRFALPNNLDGSHPSAWQARQARVVKRFLNALAEAITQQVVLCYQEFEPWELAAIIGHPPQLTLDDVLKHRLALDFDVRGLDPDWRSDLVQTVTALLSMDRGGVIDTNKAVSLLGSVFDPTLIHAITRDEAGATEALYRKAQQDVTDIILGNPPPLVEMDPTAAKQLEYAMQVIGQNQDYQRVLMQDEKRRDNMETYIKNLQHSVQETQMSPTQGRTGVAQMPQRPVQKGAPALGMGNE